jgi:hypothetical protein
VLLIALLVLSARFRGMRVFLRWEALKDEQDALEGKVKRVDKAARGVTSEERIGICVDELNISAALKGAQLTLDPRAIQAQKVDSSLLVSVAFRRA